MKNNIIENFENLVSIKQIHYDNQENLYAAITRPNHKNNTYDYKILKYQPNKKEFKEILKLKNKENFLGFYGDFLFISFEDENKKEKDDDKKKKIKYKLLDLNEKLQERYKFKTSLAIEKILDIYDDKIFFVAEEKNEKLDDEYHVEIENSRFLSDGRSGYDHAIKTKILCADLKMKKIKCITKSNENVHFVHYDELNEQILYISKEDEKVESLYSKAYKYDLKTGERLSLYNNMDFDFYGIYNTKDGIIAVGTFGKDFGLNENAKFYKVINGKLDLYYDNIFSTNNSINSDVRYNTEYSNLVNEGSLYFLSTREDKCSIYRLNSGNEELVFDGIKSVDTFKISQDKIAIAGLDGFRGQEIFLGKLYNDKIVEMSQISDFNEDYNWNVKTIKYNFKDKEILGYSIFPNNLSVGEKYPAILHVHGGPKTTYSDVLSLEMNSMIESGYIVIYTNPVGSDNFDNEFSDIRGKYGKDDYQNLMIFLDECIKSFPEIDEERIAICGGSYGGFMTNWATSQTDRFKTAITQRSISNWVTFYSTSDIGPNFSLDQLGLSEYNSDKLWDFSPLKYINQVKTPTLVIHSEEDYRCPLNQGISWYIGLLMNDVKTKFAIFKNSSHGLSRNGKPRQRILRLKNMLDWLEETI